MKSTIFSTIRNNDEVAQTLAKKLKWSV